MIRLYRCLQSYALDKTAMLSRTKCFYPEQQPAQYNQDTINYYYNLALHPGNIYQGLANIQFRLISKGHLFLDFHGKNVSEIIINQKRINPSEVQKQGKINLPIDLLKEGTNHVSVKYENEYDKDGSGCVSFVDVDKKQYLYTQFQPYMGNRVFPMFDQPDLKAKMNLSIGCPSDWEAVLSNEDEDCKNRNFVASPSVCTLTKQVLKDFQNSLPSNYKITNFHRTKLLPTYLFCFVVGPYKKYVCKNTYKDLPMSLYCIESLYPYMMKLAPFIEEMTNRSMQFFQEYFGYPYPFNKYDQVFAHEYKWGAMENAGIVTLNDLYIFKDPVSTEKMISFGNTIVHQMAHHWFGNLVTMKWWDDLWLNESFAEYISHFCLEKIKTSATTINYESAMASFLNRKGWGYAEDQLVTTHPIRSSVQNTQVAESIFDGITYSKGAATMKQLMYLMGEDAFSKALSEYFHSYEYKNAELVDLLKFMKKHYQKAAGVTIDQWKEMWLQRAGLNILASEFDGNCTLRIKQSAYHPQHPTLRSHTIKLALIENPTTIHELQVVINPVQLTEINLSQKMANQFRRAQAVVLNHQDLTFCKVIIDEKSISYLKNHLNEIEDILLRSLVWKNFFDMVKDAHMKSTEYIEILGRNLFQQKSDAVLEENLNYALTAIDKYTPKPHRSYCLSIMLRSCVEAEGLSKNRAIVIRDKIIAFSDATNLADVQALSDWFYGKETSFMHNKFGVLNITEGWKIVIKLLSSKLVAKQEKGKILQHMMGRDNSDTMKNKKITCDALMVEEGQTQLLFDKLTKDESQKWGMTTFVHAMAGLNSRVHEQSIRRSLKQKYFESVKCSLENTEHTLGTLRKSEMIQLFIDHMDPNIEDSVEDLREKVAMFAAITVKNNDKIKIQLRKKIDLLTKRIRCFNLY